MIPFALHYSADYPRALNMNRSNNILRSLLITLVSILLAGCGGLLAPQVENAHIYLLDAQSTSKVEPVKRNLVLAVSTPRARPGFDTRQMVYLRQPHELEYYAVNRWADTPARMLQPLLLQALQQTQNFQAVVQTPGVIPANIRLETELIRLQQDFGVQPSRVQLTLRAQLIDESGKRVIAAKLFDETETASSDNAYGGVIATNRALQRVLGQLIEFCVNESVIR